RNIPVLYCDSPYTSGCREPVGGFANLEAAEGSALANLETAENPASVEVAVFTDSSQAVKLLDFTDVL
ncbi:MAG TPA: hypothetical protein PLJ29_09280, partial [Leptospiraceae bacterium]|nr:hypothetical protein [Leptospiraceae bacterium]